MILRYVRRQPPLLRYTTIRLAVWSRKTFNMLVLGYTHRDYTDGLTMGMIRWLVCLRLEWFGPADCRIQLFAIVLTV